MATEGTGVEVEGMGSFGCEGEPEGARGGASGHGV